MHSAGSRLALTLGLYVAWVTTTVLGCVLAAGAHHPLTALVSHRIGWSFVAAVALLLAALLLFRWHDVGLERLPTLHSLRVMWLPALYLLTFATLSVMLGLPPISVVAFVFINTALVGLSEELMFRGILFQGLLSRFSIWPAIWITSVLFGAVHVLNVFITGELTSAMIQAVAAFMSGVGFMAIRIRTASLYPAILFHALWDFFIFLISQSPRSAALDAPSSPGGAAELLLPMLLVLPAFLYGLFLLRKVGRSPIPL